MNSDRKLATILATDCVNFSKHMEESEEKTLRNLNECRKIIDAKIIEFGGRIFKTEGDSVVSEFASPVNCLKAAIVVLKESSFSLRGLIQRHYQLLFQIIAILRQLIL